MGAACLNCKKKLGCGCQRAKASDGTSVCKSCKATYEAKLKKDKLEKFVK